jgi:hypothetical protein
MHVDNHQALHFSLSARVLRRFYQLVWGMNALVISATAATDLGFAQRGLLLLDLKLERNVAVWYSSTLLLLTAFAALAIAAQVPPQVTHPRRYRVVWGSATLFFLGLAMDETAGLHERIGAHFSASFGPLPGLTPDISWDFAWLVALFPLIIVFLVVMKVAVQWLRLHPQSRLLALAGIACWIGVLLAEGIQAQMERLAMARSIQGVIEEGLEIIGITCFLISFLQFLRATPR